MGRGLLTEKIQEIAKIEIGREITVCELRLMPYIQYVMVNEQKLDPNKLNADDREVLSKWKQAGYIEGGITGLSITKEFWDIINSVIFEGYVNCEG